MKKILGWSLGVCIVAPVLGVSAVVAVDHVWAWLECSRFASATQPDQIRLLRHAEKRRDRRFTEAVRATLQTSNDRILLETAGIAAMRIGAIELLPLIQKCADEGPDDAHRAQLIICATRLSDRDVRLYDWLMNGVESGEPWRRIGAAVGLMQIGRPEAGPLLVEIVRQGPAETRDLAMRNLAWIVRPMGQAVGKPMPWLDVNPPPTDAAALDKIDRFWQDNADTNLFNDVLCRLTNRDPDWMEMDRLIHARNKAAKWLQ